MTPYRYSISIDFLSIARGRVVFFLLCACLSQSAVAHVYKCADAAQVVMYSDFPCSTGAKKLMGGLSSGSNGYQKVAVAYSAPPGETASSVVVGSANRTASMPEPAPDPRRVLRRPSESSSTTSSFQLGRSPQVMGGMRR